MVIQVSIDRDVCSGHGRCYVTEPELFGFDDEGYGFVRSAEVPEDHRDAVQRAVDGCPERAIRLL
jgi:ferredoxin